MLNGTRDGLSNNRRYLSIEKYSLEFTRMRWILSKAVNYSLHLVLNANRSLKFRIELDLLNIYEVYLRLNRFREDSVRVFYILNNSLTLNSRHTMCSLLIQTVLNIKSVRVLHTKKRPLDWEAREEMLDKKRWEI